MNLWLINNDQVKQTTILSFTTPLLARPENNALFKKVMDFLCWDKANLTEIAH